VHLQLVRPRPQQIRNQSAKPAQRHARERQHRRRVRQSLHMRQPQPVAVLVHRLLQSPRAKNQRGAQDQQNNLFQSPAHDWFCAVASSRRLKTNMPKNAKMPPSTTTICTNAIPNSPHVMQRPLLNESTGENFSARSMTFIATRNVGTITASRMLTAVLSVCAEASMLLSETTFAIVPEDNAITKIASDKNAATGNERKLADASPMAASNAIQQKMIPSPRA